MSALCAYQNSLCVGYISNIKLGHCAGKDMLQPLHANPLPMTLARLQRAEGSNQHALWTFLLLTADLLDTSSVEYLHPTTYWL